MTKNNDYSVGRGKPPRHSQFKPGVSGNRRGRPKGTVSSDQVVLKTLYKRIRVTQDGKTKFVTLTEAILTKMAASALQGDVAAAKFILQIQQSAETSTATKEKNKPMILVLSETDMKL